MSYLVALTILFAPAYAIRFDVFGLPVNLLMLWVFLVWAIFTAILIVKKQTLHFFTAVKKCKAEALWLIGMFLLAGAISLFWPIFTLEKLGQFIVLFLQPISLFFIAGFEWGRNSASKNLLLTACYLLLAVAGIVSIVEYYTLFGLPPAYWGNSVEPKRALAFFTHPNFYALFSAPLLAFLIPDVFQNLKSKIINLKSLAWLLGAAGLLLSLSRAGWLGLGIAGLIYLLVAADKKIRKIASVVVIVMVMIVWSVPNWRWRVALPFYGERSAVSRVNLWQSGWKAVKESPILGLGLKGFGENWERLKGDARLDRHNFPHNIFLNFWVETGILGLISLIGLIGLMIYRGVIQRADVYKLSVALFLIALVAQGLLDNPYFKNDLALVFWIILSLGI